VLGADLDQQLPISPGHLGELRNLDRGAGGGACEHHRHHGEQTALRRGLTSAHLPLECQQPPKHLSAGKAAHHASGGGLELEPQEQLPIQAVCCVEYLVAGGDRCGQVGGNEARHGEAECRLRALGRTNRQAFRLLHPAGRLGHAGSRLSRAEVD
jgi:hypothetical protein